MLIKGNIQRSRAGQGPLIWLLTLVGLSILFLIGYPLLLVHKASEQKNVFVSCDAEEVEGKYFLTDNNVKVFGSNLQSSAFSRSGTHSVKLDAENAYGFTVELDNPPAATLYSCEVWRYTKTAGKVDLVVSGQPGDFYAQSEKVMEIQGKWEKVQLIFQTPAKALDHIKIYAWANSNEGVYLDDLSIRPLKNTMATIDSLPFDQISLFVEPQEFKKLDNKKQAASEIGLLVSADDDWVKGKLKDDRDGFETDITLRLKGDWTDHLRGDKWSFRIKTEKDKSFKRLKTFSIQHPSTRSYMREWLYHRFLQSEDVLTPRYDFIRVTLNGQPRGIYAIEEHFEKQLPEYNKRREGPILKFSEEAYWQLILQRKATGAKMVQDHNANALNSGVIRGFKESSLMADSTRLSIYTEAIRKLYAYKNGTQPIEDVFDIEKTARYFATMDLFNAHHGLTWHNSRFYYNPVIRKLEPVGFDGFGETSGDYVRPFLAYHYNTTQKVETEPYKQLFASPIFMDAYIKALLRYSDKEFVQIFLANIKEDLDNRKDLLLSEFPDAFVDASYIVERAKKIRLHLLPLGAESVRAHWDAASKKLYVRNAHAVGLRVVGYSFGKNSDIGIPPVYMQMQQRNAVPKFHEIPFKNTPGKTPRFVDYQMAGLDSVYRTPVLATPIPIFQKTKTSTATLPDFVIEEGNTIKIPEGEFTLNQLMEIPAGKTLWLDAGAKIVLEEGAGILSYSAVQLRGTADNPIVIEAKTAQNSGFTVLQAKEESMVSHAIFKNLNALQKGSWNMTGAVTFYESPITINRMVVTDNQCEDAVNLIRCHIRIQQLKIINALRDALDGDFCTGQIDNIEVINPGNDGLDFSGSQLHIVNCNITQAGDKGISVGEESTVSIGKATINGAVSALASKDLSKVYVDEINIKNCTRAFAAYRKKPEYGPATIEVKKYTSEGVKFLQAIEKGSKLVLP